MLGPEARDDLACSSRSGLRGAQRRVDRAGRGRVAGTLGRLERLLGLLDQPLEGLGRGRGAALFR